MERGNLVIYDLEGTIISQSGEAMGFVLPHSYPVGIPYLEIPFGTMNLKQVVSIDVSVTPNIPVTIDIDVTPEPYEPPIPEVPQPTNQELADNQMILMEVLATMYEEGLIAGSF